MHKRILIAASAWLSLAGFQAPPAPAPQAEVSIWRLDCGEIHVTDLDVFSDAWLYEGQQKTLTDSCYLIRNGDRYMLWDSGLPAALVGNSAVDGVFRLSLRTSIRDQLARFGVRPDQIAFVAISHSHFDHIGQASDFPAATLLIGRADWEVIRANPESAARFVPWISGGATVRPVGRDHDVFGDRSVVMLDMPGHTPGHHSLLVRASGRAPILLTGDLYHFTEQVRNAGVPIFNTNRADTLASFARFHAISDALGAQIVIQHEPNDIMRVPPIPTTPQ